MTFQLDKTGGVGPMPGWHKPVPNSNRFIFWSDFSPFMQDYTEALLGSLTAQPGQWFYMASGGVNVGATFVSFGSHNGVEDRVWSLVHLDRGGKRCAGPKRLELTSKLVPCFSDLAPETLARIIADCEKVCALYGFKDAEEGAAFWDARQEKPRPLQNLFRETFGALFPPLTVQLCDDGKVRFA